MFNNLFAAVIAVIKIYLRLVLVCILEFVAGDELGSQRWSRGFNVFQGQKHHKNQGLVVTF